jgi:hypothetical protein
MMMSLTELAKQLEEKQETEVPEKVLVSPTEIMKALRDGGRAEVTLRSWKTGEHVYVTLTCRKKKPGGDGWMSRGEKAGRVGYADADCVEARDPNLEYGENYIGRFYIADGEWRAGKNADAKRVWAAERVVVNALTGAPMQSDLFLATRCVVCGKKLRHPESVADLIGPECKAQKLKGKHAGYDPVADEQPSPTAAQEDEDFTARWAEHKDEFARREIAAERAAYAAEEDLIPCMACGKLQAADGDCRCWV